MELLYIFGFIFALIGFGAFCYVSFDEISKNFPMKSKDIFDGEKIEPKRTILAAGIVDMLSFKGPFFKMRFYNEFLTVSFLDRYLKINFSEKIEIGCTFLGTNFVKFPDVNPKITFYLYSKNDVEYIKERFNNYI